MATARPRVAPRGLDVGTASLARQVAFASGVDGHIEDRLAPIVGIGDEVDLDATGLVLGLGCARHLSRGPAGGEERSQDEGAGKWARRCMEAHVGQASRQAWNAHEGIPLWRCPRRRGCAGEDTSAKAHEPNQAGQGARDEPSARRAATKVGRRIGRLRQRDEPRGSHWRRRHGREGERWLTWAGLTRSVGEVSGRGQWARSVGANKLGCDGLGPRECTCVRALRHIFGSAEESPPRRTRHLATGNLPTMRACTSPATERRSKAPSA